MAVLEQVPGNPEEPATKGPLATPRFDVLEGAEECLLQQILNVRRRSPPGKEVATEQATVSMNQHGGCGLVAVPPCGNQLGIFGESGHGHRDECERGMLMIP
jgi:hypothetical protein